LTCFCHIIKCIYIGIMLMFICHLYSQCHLFFSSEINAISLTVIKYLHFPLIKRKKIRVRCTKSLWNTITATWPSAWTWTKRGLEPSFIRDKTTQTAR
jgi:hypothetical protein